MRLVSQHGNVDIPYENAILSHNNNIVRADVGDFDFTMGVYSSGEKAYKVMEMVRKKYLASTEIIDENICYTTLTRAVVFKFPSDDEVEV